jgi:hypothetical protein
MRSLQVQSVRGVESLDWPVEGKPNGCFGFGWPFPQLNLNFSCFLRFRFDRERVRPIGFASREHFFLKRSDTPKAFE